MTGKPSRNWVVVTARSKRKWVVRTRYGVKFPRVTQLYCRFACFIAGHQYGPWVCDEFSITEEKMLSREAIESDAWAHRVCRRSLRKIAGQEVFGGSCGTSQERRPVDSGRTSELDQFKGGRPRKQFRFSTVLYVIFSIAMLMFEVNADTSSDPQAVQWSGVGIGWWIIGSLVFGAYRGLTRGRNRR